MKVYVFGTRGFPGIQGGVEKHCEALYTNLPSEFQITVFRRKPYVLESTSYPNIRFKDLYSTKIKGVEALIHSFLCTLFCICKRPDIVHIHNIGPGCFIPLLRFFNLKVILTYHSANYEHQKWGKLSQKMLKISEYIALHFSNQIIFVNRFQLEKQRSKIRKKSVYIPNGPSILKRNDGTNYISSLGLIPGKYILAVGRITPEKGFEDLIDAFLLLDTKEEYKLVIAGGVEHETTYLNYLKNKSNSKKIIYTGFVTKKPLEELYTHTRLFVLPSHNEGFPLVVLEAMQIGCDILLSDIPATRLLVLPDNLYFSMGNVSDLILHLKEKLNKSNPVIHSYNILDFDWKKICHQTSIIYNSLTKKTI